MSAGTSGVEPNKISATRGQPSVKTQKELFAHSGNRCAFPGCDNHLVKEGIVLGEVCHIKAASRQGPRFDGAQSEVDRQSAANLILLCADHHKIVDSDPANYSVEKLQKMKGDHEAGKPAMRSAEVNKAIHSGQTFITNIFHGNVNAVAQGNASIGGAHQSLGSVSHQLNCSMLKLTVGDSGPYVSTKGSGLYDIKRTYSLKLENIDHSRTVYGCKLHLLSIEPSEGYEGPWVLGEEVSLAAGDHKFIPLVRYGEARNPETFNCADTFMEVLPGKPGSPNMDKEAVHYLHVRVTGIDAAPAEMICQIWVDSKGRLQITEQRSQTLISLREAARRAYEHTRGTELADMAERHDGTPEGVLAYYADLIAEHHPILVKKPPSNSVENYPRELWNKMSLCDQLNGIKYHGSQRSVYIEPVIREDELMLFLEWTEQYRQDMPRLESKV